MQERLPIGTLVIASVLVAALSGACGKVKPSDASGAAGSAGNAGSSGGAGSFTTTGSSGTNGTIHVNVSGVASPHPLNKMLLGEDEDFSQLKIAIIDPSATIFDPAAPPLGSMALDTSAGNCPSGCKWALAGVDITNLSLGLVGTLEDLRTGTARLWVKTGTGMGTAAQLDAVRALPAPITDRQAFAVSRKLEAVIGKFVGTALMKTFGPGDLETRGFLIGHVVDKLSTGPVPAGVAGATVVGTGSFDVVYPTADFSATGTTTSTNGIFIAVPQTPGAMVAMWDVLPPTGDTRRWARFLAGANPNSAFVAISPADED
jgi:hypothetical protein